MMTILAGAVTAVPKSKVMRSPRSLDLEITSRCNLRCRYCYYFNNPVVNYTELPAEEWLDFFSELGELGVMDLSLAGGEPFMREDLPRLIEGIVRNRMRYNLLSNGSLITDDMAAFLASTHRCNHVQISIDGSRPETHDVFRGKGSFDGALRGLRTLQRHGVPVTVRVTLHRHNVADLEATTHLLLDELGLGSFGTNAAGYLGNCRRYADEVMLTVEDRMLAMQTLARLTECYPGRIQANAGPLAEVRYWSKMEEARRTSAAPFPNGGHLTACGCANSKLAVRADGIIVPCNMLAHIELGRINKDSLFTIWHDHPDLNALRQRYTIPLSSFEFCADCDYQPYCTGNCPALAYTLTGQVNGPSPDACLRNFLAQGGRLNVATLERSNVQAW